MPSPLGEKIRRQRKQLGMTLDELAELAESSKSYIWELENKDTPNPSAEKVAKLANALRVTTEFLLSEAAADPDEKVRDEAFFRKYQKMSPETKRHIQRILDTWDKK